MSEQISIPSTFRNWNVSFSDRLRMQLATWLIGRHITAVFNIVGHENDGKPTLGMAEGSRVLWVRRAKSINWLLDDATLDEARRILRPH